MSYKKGPGRDLNEITIFSRIRVETLLFFITTGLINMNELTVFIHTNTVAV